MAGHYYMPVFRHRECFYDLGDPRGSGNRRQPRRAGRNPDRRRSPKHGRRCCPNTPVNVTRVVELGEGRTFARMLSDAAISNEDLGRRHRLEQGS